MSVIRTLHNRSNPYVQINKNALLNNRLSLKARGLWAMCLSRPDDWEFHISEIIKNTKEGKAAIYAAIEELIAERYCVRHQKKEGPNFSRWGQVEYIFFEFSLSPEELDEFKKSLPHSTFQHAENQHAENRTLLNTNTTNPSSSPAGESEERREKKPERENIPLFVFGNVKMKSCEYEALKFRWGEETLEKKLKELDDYAILKPHKFKEYKSHYIALNNWLKRDEKPQEEKESEKQFIEKLQELYAAEIAKNQIVIGNGYIEFPRPYNTVSIGNKGKGFKESVINELRKMNLDVSELKKSL